MPDPKPIQLSSSSTVEDVMAALAHQSIFDLPTLARQLVKVASAQGTDDEPEAIDILLYPTYALIHSADVETEIAETEVS